MTRKNSVIQYVRNSKGKPLGVLVAVKSEDEFRVGYSLCCSRDRFKKETGLHIAFGRADVWSSIPEEIPRDILRLLPDFVARCKKYYKTSKSPAIQTSTPF